MEAAFTSLWSEIAAGSAFEGTVIQILPFTDSTRTSQLLSFEASHHAVLPDEWFAYFLLLPGVYPYRKKFGIHLVDPLMTLSAAECVPGEFDAFEREGFGPESYLPINLCTHMYNTSCIYYDMRAKYDNAAVSISADESEMLWPADDSWIESHQNLKLHESPLELVEVLTATVHHNRLNLHVEWILPHHVVSGTYL
jgi:hypothetical protein